MSKPWELTIPTWDEASESTKRTVDALTLFVHLYEPEQPEAWRRLLADAMNNTVKKFLDYLASQCGENPCEKCIAYDPEYCITGERWCKERIRYLGQQQGIAKGMQIARGGK